MSDNNETMTTGINKRQSSSSVANLAMARWLPNQSLAQVVGEVIQPTTCRAPGAVGFIRPLTCRAHVFDVVAWPST